MTQDLFNEQVHAYIAAKYYQELTTRYAKRGQGIFIHATQYYASTRGRRMAQRALRDGKELTYAVYQAVRCLFLRPPEAERRERLLTGLPI